MRTTRLTASSVIILGWAALTAVVLPIATARASKPADSPAPRRPTPDQTVLPAEGFARLSALILPHPGESQWASINWQTSLWEARQKAVAEGKPIFILGAASGSAIGFC